VEQQGSMSYKQQPHRCNLIIAHVLQHVNLLFVPLDRALLVNAIKSSALMDLK